ncbi:DevA family ABC transporter ATP-binding protein [Planktothrix agardhii]|jgi:putative ABC transport system ATP-binding protein|uniref:DevA family ABC transporter ATP-binding protein n=1 Tax=Planktothrix agardhii TaxID=1160 RepID=UPI001A235352|nr:DevA family ABC transporter ATP-binding protein [Planktothrix agardhii]MBG0746672.1 DevA family ABC transporter ATP-binding protein [Planktothrix agardhii KL2]MCB8762877.1 DevA family ABC transporter ATP-binding protein [Planktothrix agardhii 1809]MCB8776473.1 DevA family ABC transporter ATP-binding protein [Planktothrix agardhii 1031]MCB8780899.1 DevA family ABC transporter ATP-binding protein [Planktothrix agardhii 1808]MCF3567914.1 DevA family ABC transporter ATP-binding protein [Plankto
MQTQIQDIQDSTKTNTAIAIQNLDHYFGKGQLQKQVLYDINLEITIGEIVIMTGPSGSGKTTLLTLIGALRSVQSGSLNILGRELLGARSGDLVKARRNTGYIFQAHNLHGSLTTLQNVQMGLEVQGKFSRTEIQQKATAMLEKVGLGNRLNYYPDNLSGGQKQRVAIARALVSHPPIVLADEPTAALDSHSGRDVVNLMQTLAKEQGCTILIVTHDNRILDVADRIIKMEDGALVTNSELTPNNQLKM